MASLLSGARSPVVGESSLRLPDYVDEILASGFPGIRALTARAQRAQLDGYLARVVDRDFPEQGQSVRRPATLRAWLTAYAAATATTTTYSKIIRAAVPAVGEHPARTTSITYREVLSRFWLLDPLPAWTPSRNVFTRIQQVPKHYLADPALAARLLGATTASLLDGLQGEFTPRDGTLLGSLFESLAALTVRVTAQLAEATTFHLRTSNGDHEVDFIVERDDHKVAAFEVKLGRTVNDRDVVHLHWLSRRIGQDLLDAVVLTTGTDAYRRRDGIAVVPLALLGA